MTTLESGLDDSIALTMIAKRHGVGPSVARDILSDVMMLPREQQTRILDRAVQDAIRKLSAKVRRERR